MKFFLLFSMLWHEMPHSKPSNIYIYIALAHKDKVAREASKCSRLSQQARKWVGKDYLTCRTKSKRMQNEKVVACCGKPEQKRQKDHWLVVTIEHLPQQVPCS